MPKEAFFGSSSERERARMLQYQQQQPQQQPTGTGEGTTTDPSGEAPPKQVAMAMERLGQASRLIADIRIGADRLLEAVYASAESQHSTKPFESILQEEISMRTHFQDLRTIGRQLEETGVLSEALRSRSNSWGLHMPLVCPDGAVVAYAWKRQLAGQAGASAVDRTRLALKSFTDQKRRFFPHLDAEQSVKRHCGSLAPTLDNQEEPTECITLEDTISCLEKEFPDIKISTFSRLAWSKRASLLPSSANDDSVETSIGHSYRSANSLRPGALGATPVDKVAVIELFIPSILRAIVSLHPVGSTSPDAVAFFSPDEGGSYLHPRGLSVYHVFKHITEYANMALQHFRGVDMDGALLSFLRWLGSYQTLFSKPCSKCGRLLSMDRQLAIILPPVHRSYRQQSDLIQAYHIGCSPPQDM